MRCMLRGLRNPPVAAAAAMLLLAALLVTARPAAAAGADTGRKVGKALLPVPVTAAGFAPQEQLVSGAAAVASLGSDLAAVAAYYDKSPAELQSVLLRDPDLHMDGATRELLYKCVGLHASAPSSSAGGGVSAAGTATSSRPPVIAKADGRLPADPNPPPADWDKLHSRPGSSKTIFLDFRGCNVPAPTPWRPDGQPISTAPYSLDEDPAFSVEEQQAMVLIWQAVAADFADLDVDVTTQDPGLDALFMTSADDTQYGMRVCIGGTFMANEAAAGLAYGDTFVKMSPSYGPDNWGSQPVWVFSPNAPMDASYVAFAVSHELGHALGLDHDGCINSTGGVDAYFRGVGSWMPIMGGGDSRAVQTFDRGEYACANNGQEDYSVITRPFFLQLLQDDGIGDSLPTALKLCSSNASTCVSTNGSTLATAHGMVSTSRKGGADAKVFKLPARAGSSLTAAVQVVSPASDIDFKPIPWVLSNLQYTLEILAANGDVVAGPISSTSDLTLGSIALSYSVPSDGVVYIRVKPATVMGQPSTYGVAGAFTLSAQFTSLTEAVICPTTGLPECVYETSGVVVVPAAGSCTTDDKGFCAAVPNSSATCRYAYKPSTVVCRPANGTCDLAETCSSTSATCPPDASTPNCPPTCPTSGNLPTCVYKTSGVWVQPPEVCNREDPTVFCNDLENTPFVCRYAFKPGCEECSEFWQSVPDCVNPVSGAMLQGDAALACSTDTSGFCFSINETAACRYDFVPRGETCWPALHYCDLDATCSGSSGECPSENPENPACPVTCPKEGLPDCVDAESAVRLKRLQACNTNSTTWCTVASDSGFSCAYGYKPDTVVCRAATGPCDVAERCSGSSATCPRDAVAPSTLACRSGGDACFGGYCNGRAKTCPGSVRVKDNTGCTQSPKAIFGKSAALNAVTAAQAKARGYVRCGKCVKGVCNTSTQRWCWN